MKPDVPNSADRTRLDVRQSVITKGRLVNRSPSTYGWRDYDDERKKLTHAALENVTADSPMREIYWSEFEGTFTENSQHYGLEVDVRVGSEVRTWRYEGNLTDLVFHVLGIETDGFF